MPTTETKQIVRATSSAWKPIAMAPKDGRRIRARGWNFGDPINGRHVVWAKWIGSHWIDADDEDQMLRYLIEWHPGKSRDATVWNKAVATMADECVDAITNLED